MKKFRLKNQDKNSEEVACELLKIELKDAKTMGCWEIIKDAIKSIFTGRLAKAVEIEIDGKIIEKFKRGLIPMPEKTSDGTNQTENNSGLTPQTWNLTNAKV